MRKRVAAFWQAAEAQDFGAFSDRGAARTDFAADIAFLASRGVLEAVLRQAERQAAHNGTAAADELIASGFDRKLYWTMLAEDLGLPFSDDLTGADLVSDAGLSDDVVQLAAAVLVMLGGKVMLVAAPRGDEIALLERRLAEQPGIAARVRIAAPETIRAFIAARREELLADHAVHRLGRALPSLSSGRKRARGARGPFALLAAVLALGLAAPVTTFTAIGLLSTLFFLNCSFWKLQAAFRRLRPLRLEPIADHRLPTYSVLVPLYREARVVADLVSHLQRVDYPSAKLQVLLIVEADDLATRAAVGVASLPPHFETVVVPAGGPRTKPKALTYALPFVRGKYVVVFDAEDRPELDQLRRAAAAFNDAPGLGCVQARLTPDNEESWLARMFAVEYAANFEVLLPALAERCAPLPLGGTSNHFPRAVLERVAAWDPFNVTEDADLGIRLARFGYRSTTIFSRTYEEAPVLFRQWLPQRRRWIKGWMQTVALNLGKGIHPNLRLSLTERLAMHGILSAGVLGLLLYPASLLVIVGALIALKHGALPEGHLARTLLALNLANAAAVLVSAVVSSWRGLVSARMTHLSVHVLALPIYWALMSIAAWQALFQFFRRPSEWEKTAHGVAFDRRTPPDGRRFL